MRIRRFNESFDSEEYLDYLLSEIEEKNISFKDSSNFFLYVQYDILSGRAGKIDNYIKLNPRFNDVITISKYDFDLDYHRILLVDRAFYTRNQKWLYRNLKWGKHPLAKLMDETPAYNSMLASDGQMETEVWSEDLYKKFQKAEKAINLKGNLSIIRNLDRMGQVEIWDSNIMEDPIRVWEDDIPKLQYLLFKYLGE